jgi:hypothetical protein
MHATRDSKQIHIQIGIPVPTEVELKKRLVEASPMQLLGIDKGAVHIEQQGFQLHSLSPSCR